MTEEQASILLSDTAKILDYFDAQNQMMISIQNTSLLFLFTLMILTGFYIGFRIGK